MEGLEGGEGVDGVGHYVREGEDGGLIFCCDICVSIAAGQLDRKGYQGVPVSICANKVFACPSVSTTSPENLSVTSGMTLSRPMFVNQGMSPGHKPCSESVL